MIRIASTRSIAAKAAAIAAAVTLALAINQKTQAQDASKAPVKANHHFSLGGKGKTYRREFEISEIDLPSSVSEGRYTIIDDTWEPGMMAPPHYHKEHAETF